MGHGVQDLNTEDFEFVQDAVYHAKGYMGYSRQERRRQTLAFRLRKDRARQRTEERKRNQRRREDLPHIPIVAPLTEVQAWVAGMQPPLKPRAVFTKQWRNTMARKWQRTLRADPAMADLLNLVDEGFILGRDPQLLVRELQASADSLDLDDIHPIFSKTSMERSFLETELNYMALRNARENMRPALALATKFLTDPQLGGFWYHLMYGAPITDMATKKSYLDTDPREADTETARTDWLALLDELANRMQFNWQPTQRAECGDIDACHASHGYRKHLNRPAAGYNGFIGVGVHWLWHLLSPFSATCRSLQADLGFQLSLAITFAHEIGHAVYAMRRLPSIVFQNGRCEVHAYSTDFQNEIGESFEHHLWKGVQIIGFMEHESQCEVCVRTWKGTVLGTPIISTAVPESWLRDLFRRGTWDDVSKHIDLLPRPDGETRDFAAERYFPAYGFANVHYVDGEATLDEEPRTELENYDGNPKVEGDLQTWWDKIREADMAEAVRRGTHISESYWGPRLELLGQSAVRIPNDDSSSGSGSAPGPSSESLGELLSPVTSLASSLVDSTEESMDEDKEELEEGTDEVLEGTEEDTEEEPAGDQSVGLANEYLGESEEEHQDDVPTFFNDLPVDPMDEDAEALDDDSREDFESLAENEDYPSGDNSRQTSEAGSEEESGDPMVWTADEDLWELPLVPEDESIASVTESEASEEAASSDSASLEESEDESESEDSDGSSTGDSTLDLYASDQDEVGFERAELSPAGDIINEYDDY